MQVVCPNCGQALTFNPTSGFLECQFCGTKKMPGFSNQKQPQQAQQTSESGKIKSVREKVELSQYHCQSCGAVLLLNGSAVSDICVYCGMPTIVYDRVSQEDKPDGIIPFKLTQQQALEKIREACEAKYGKDMLPEAIQNLKYEEIRGIYAPYMIYTCDCKKYLLASRREGSKDHKKTYNYYIEGEATYDNVPFDASKDLPDEMALYLEPYNKKGIEEFSTDYLSGFFANKFDIKDEEGITGVSERCDVFMTELIATKLGSQSGTNPGDYESIYYYDVKDSNFVMRVSDKLYCLFPVYIATFKLDNGIFRVMVNGQTGKVVGNVPCLIEEQKKIEKKDVTNFLKLFPIIFATIFLFTTFGNPIFGGLMTLIWVFIVWANLSGSKKKYNKMLEQNRQMASTQNFMRR